MEPSPVASSSKVTLTSTPPVKRAERTRKKKKKSLIAAQPSRAVDGESDVDQDEPAPSLARALGGQAEDGTPLKVKRSKKKDAAPQPDDQAAGPPSWQCAPLARHENSRLPAIWSADGRFYFKASGSAVLVHSANPPDYPLRTTLSETEETSPVIAYHLHPDNPMLLIVALRNGSTNVWDWPDGTLLRTIPLRLKRKAASEESQYLHSVTVGVDAAQEAVGYAAVADKDSATTSVVQFSLAQKQKQRPSSAIKSFAGLPTTIAIAPSGRYLLLVTTKGLHICDLTASATQGKWLSFTAPHHVTCAVWYPTAAAGGGAASSMHGREGDWFATGDVKGKIRLFHGLAEAFQNDFALAAQGKHVGAEAFTGQLPSTVWHWHAHAVACLAFGSSGATLLSGGEENTLVKWAVETGQKDFLPRLGSGGIKSIAVKSVRRGGDQEEYWVTLGDGSVVKNAAGTGTAVGVGRPVRADPVYRVGNAAAAPLAFHAPSGSIVLPGPHPSTIQFYDVATQSVLFDLEVAPSNRVSRKEDVEIEPIRVQRVAFCHDASGRSAWMATTEARDGDEHEGGGKVRALKLWRWDSKAKTYALNTHIPHPHELSNITSLLFCDPPSNAGPSAQSQATLPYLLTTGKNGSAKLWSVKATAVSAAGKERGQVKTTSTEMFWALRSTFSYRDLPIVSAAVSPDNSLIALAHANMVTLWDTQSNIMLRTLERGIAKITEVFFVGNSGRWILARGDAGLCAWDLLATEVAWIQNPKPSRRGLAHPGFPYFLSLNGHRTTPKAAPTAIVTLIQPETGETVQSFSVPRDIRHWAWARDPADALVKVSDVELIGLDKYSHALRLGSNVLQQATVVSAIHGGKSLDEQRRATIWEEMFGPGSLGDSGIVDTPAADVSAVKTASFADKRGRVSSVFDGPAYTLPPVDLLLDDFLADFMGEEEAAPTAAQPKEDIIMTNLDADAAAQEGRIFVEDSMILPPAHAASEICEVPEEDLAELTGWFRDLFSKPKSALPPVVSTPAHSAPTGTPTPQGPSSSHKKKNKHKSTPQANGTPSRAPTAGQGPVPSPIVMPEFSAKKRKEAAAADAAAAAAAGEQAGQKRKVVPE